MDLFTHSGISLNTSFQRSTRIDNKISKIFLDNFIFHDTGKKVLNQIANSITNTNQSAFSLTGPYGTGKSSLGLFLNAIISQDNKIKKQAEKISNYNFTLTKRFWLVNDYSTLRYKLNICFRNLDFFWMILEFPKLDF